MAPELKQQLLALWQTLPPECRKPVATQAELEMFESEHGPIPSEFKWFLEQCGGGVVGAEWVDGVRELGTSHVKFKSESGPGGWTMQDVFVFGWDGQGNPMAIELGSGAVVVEDHNFGGMHQLAPSFAEFLSTGLRTSGEL